MVCPLLRSTERPRLLNLNVDDQVSPGAIVAAQVASRTVLRLFDLGVLDRRRDSAGGCA